MVEVNALLEKIGPTLKGITAPVVRAVVNGLNKVLPPNADLYEPYTPQLHHFTSPEDHPKGTVLLAHGYAEHHGRFLHVIDGLTAAGWDVITYDHRGHGEAMHTAAPLPSAVDVAQLVRDHLEVRRRALDIIRPSSGFTQGLVLMGHSMGGIITARSAELDGTHLNGIVLSGPAFRPAPKVPAAVATMVTPLARRRPLIKSAGIDGKGLCHDDAVIEAYNNDPLVWRDYVPLIAGTSMITEGDRAIDEGGKIKVPTLIMHGSADPLALPEGSFRFANAIRATGGDVIVRLEPNLFHEILNEPVKDQLIADIVEFLDKKVAQ